MNQVMHNTWFISYQSMRQPLHAITYMIMYYVGAQLNSMNNVVGHIIQVHKFRPCLEKYHL